MNVVVAHEGKFAYADMIESPEYGRLMLFATSYLPPSINRSYRSYAVSYKPKGADPSVRKWRGVFSASQSLRNWKSWGEEISRAIHKESGEKLWFEDGSIISSIKVSITMGNNSDIDARTKAVQDVFQGYVFGNDNSISLSGDIKIATHKRYDQGVVYILCGEDFHFDLLNLVYESAQKIKQECEESGKKRKLSMHGETSYKLYCEILGKLRCAH